MVAVSRMGKHQKKQKKLVTVPLMGQRATGKIRVSLALSVHGGDALGCDNRIDYLGRLKNCN